MRISIYQIILDEDNLDNIHEFDQYMKSRIEKLENIIYNLDSNLDKGVSISRYNKDITSKNEIIKTLETRKEYQKNEAEIKHELDSLRQENKSYEIILAKLNLEKKGYIIAMDKLKEENNIKQQQNQEATNEGL
ncbi:19873_t:CDS:2 [Racocetra fulgida]|uniref:19873_t:CDS:1 n=1 Tax=Racocetra fulgida TaxID=60492 RepID=A0A9N8ZKE8_9GLOM|nr:19873_t:CDS:2 [Racocetra fulgida]